MDENIFVLMHIFILVADYGREGPLDAKIILCRKRVIMTGVISLW